MAIRVLIVDDHAVVRTGLRLLLDREDDIEVVGEAGDGEEAVGLADELRPDVAIMDISMPKLDGIEATREIKRRCPSVMVLILSAYDDDQFVFALISRIDSRGCTSSICIPMSVKRFSLLVNRSYQRDMAL